MVDQSPGADGTSTLVNVDVQAEQAPTIALLAARIASPWSATRVSDSWAILLLTSTAGSPGVTTLAVGLALTWPRPVLLVDATPELIRRSWRATWPGAGPAARDCSGWLRRIGIGAHSARS